jgi:UDP-glucose 4-epimerase
LEYNSIKPNLSNASNVLVLGGLGFVGRHVCKHLYIQGVEVYALGHGTIPKSELGLWGISNWVEARISEEILTQNYAGVEFGAVIHCAGSGAVALSFSHPADDFHRSVTSVFSSLEFVRKMQPKHTRFVLASSAAVYGNQNIELDENALKYPISPYGMHKQMAESVCEEYSKYFALNASIVGCRQQI